MIKRTQNFDLLQSLDCNDHKFSMSSPFLFKNVAKYLSRSMIWQKCSVDLTIS